MISQRRLYFHLTHFGVGRRLAGDAVVVELPYDLVLRLPPLSAGRGYRLVDGDLAVIALSTLIVLDAIELI